jgi:hypothetical protein
VLEKPTCRKLLGIPVKVGRRGLHELMDRAFDGEAGVFGLQWRFVYYSLAASCREFR